VWDPKSGVALLSLPNKADTTPQVLFAPDGQSIIAKRTQISGFEWRAHPFRPEDLPGDIAGDWRTRFERWWQNET
jgi:hypothetical protein